MFEPAGLATEVLRLAMQMALASAKDAVAQGGEREKLPRTVSVQLYRQRLAGLGSGMTRRELDVCARMMAGLSAEGIAIDLGVKKSSVVTYRKRAYARLGISSQNELFQFVL